MRVRCWMAVASVALVVLAACGSSAGMSSRSSTPGAGAAAACGSAGAPTLVADTVARVYRSGGNVYGCAARGGHSYLLGSSARSIREGRAGPVALAGTDVAYGYTTYGVDTVSAQVIVRDLASGKQLRSAPPTTQPPHVEFVESVAAIVVKPDGAAAWIGETGSLMGGAKDVEVDRADGRGVARLDSGSGIGTSSLKLRGSTVTWRDGGRTRSAQLR